MSAARAIALTGDGRSPDLRVTASPNLPKPIGPVVFFGVAHRSQLRGQSRNRGKPGTVFPFHPFRAKARSGTITDVIRQTQYEGQDKMHLCALFAERNGDRCRPQSKRETSFLCAIRADLELSQNTLQIWVLK